MTFKELLLASTGYVYLYRVQLSKALVFPFLLFICIDVLGYYNEGMVYAAARFIATVIIQTFFSIIIYRILLLGPSAIPEWGYWEWTERETSYTLYGLILTLVFAPLGLALIMPALAIVILPLTLLGAVLLLPRLCVVFPAIAIGEVYSFKSAWHLTENHRQLMFNSVIGIPIVLTLPIILIGRLPYTFLLTSVLTNLVMVVMAASVSVSYKYISDEAKINS